MTKYRENVVNSIRGTNSNTVPSPIPTDAMHVKTLAARCVSMIEVGRNIENIVSTSPISIISVSPIGSLDVGFFRYTDIVSVTNKISVISRNFITVYFFPTF